MRVVLSAGGLQAKVTQRLNATRRSNINIASQPYNKGPRIPLGRSTPRLLQRVSAAAGLQEEVESDDEISEEDIETFDASSIRNSEGGYTPFEFIEFTEIPLKHEVTIHVNAPVEACYQAWDSRLNWMQWFDLIDEMGFHEEEPSYVSMYLWYRYARTPFLELYCTLSRTKEEKNKYILEEPVEGMPLIAAVLFQPGDSEEQGQGTTVTLRISYLLPKVLHEFVGRVGVYGDVDDKLSQCMLKMKAFVETVGEEELQRTKQVDDGLLREGFEMQRKLLKEEEEARQAEEEKKSAEAALAAQEELKRQQEEELAFGQGLGLASESEDEQVVPSTSASLASSQEAGGTTEVASSQEGSGTEAATTKRKVTRRKASAASGASTNPAANRKPRKSKDAAAGTTTSNEG